jgi:hypothetical protein
MGPSRDGAPLFTAKLPFAAIAIVWVTLMVNQPWPA